MAKLPIMALKISTSDSELHGTPFVVNSSNDASVKGSVVKAYAEAL